MNIMKKKQKAISEYAQNLLLWKNCFRFFVRYNNYDHNITTLLIKLPKLTGFVKHFEEIIRRKA